MFSKYFVSEIMLARNHMFCAGDDVESVFRVDDWDDEKFHHAFYEKNKIQVEIFAAKMKILS